MKLKELRLRMRLTQQQLAEHMKTTQQTIARWESGKTSIPSNNLKDLASLLGVGIDELLGARPDASQAGDEGFASVEHDLPFGTLRAIFPFGVREYPIDEQQKQYVIRSLEKRQAGWLSFSALDNRIALINRSFLRAINLVTDDVEAMPFFASPQAYKSLTDGAQADEIGPIVRDEMERVIEALSAGQPPERARQLALDAMSTTVVRWADGTTNGWPMLTEEEATFLEYIEANGADGFQILQSDRVGIFTFINLQKVAVIEAPLQRYQDLLDAVPL